MVKTFKVLHPTREDWKKSFPSTNPMVNYWYTDGSGTNDRYGAGIYGPKNNHRESIYLGNLATVFQGEVLAIHRCAEILLAGVDARHRYCICSDSKAALDALNKTITESSVVWRCMLALNRLREFHELTLVGTWSPRNPWQRDCGQAGESGNT